MLSLSQKESILRKKGVTIPPFPVRRAFRGLDPDEIQAIYEREKQEVDLEVEMAVNRWQASVELLYETNIRRPVETAIQMVKARLIPSSHPWPDRTEPGRKLVCKRGFSAGENSVAQRPSEVQ